MKSAKLSGRKEPADSLYILWVLCTKSIKWKHNMEIMCVRPAVYPSAWFMSETTEWISINFDIGINTTSSEVSGDFNCGFIGPVQPIIYVKLKSNS
jgi:hypothetical protein